MIKEGGVRRTEGDSLLPLPLAAPSSASLSHPSEPLSLGLGSGYADMGRLGKEAVSCLTAWETGAGSGPGKAQGDFSWAGPQEL